MRRVRYSTTFLEQLDTVIAMGEDRFGARVVDEKRARVLQLIERHIADKPRTGNLDDKSGLYWYPVSRTPCVVYYISTRSSCASSTSCWPALGARGLIRPTPTGSDEAAVRAALEATRPHLAPA